MRIDSGIEWSMLKVTKIFDRWRRQLPVHVCASAVVDFVQKHFKCLINTP